MKKIVAILLAVMMVLSFTACAQKSNNKPADAKAKLGVVVPDLNNSFCIAMDTGVKRAAAEKGYEVFEYVTEMNPENDVNSVEMLASNGVKAYYGLHMVGQSVGDVLKTKYTDIGCFSQTVFDGATQALNDDFNIVAEQFIASLDKFMKENGLTEAEIVGIWLGNAQIEGTTEYVQYNAFMNKIQSYYANSGVKYVQSEYPADAEGVANTVETLMLSTKATVFFCHNNDYAITTANTITSAVADTKNYFIFATEGDNETYRLIADSKSPYRAASVADTEETGYQIGLQLVNWVENGKMEPVSVSRTLVDWTNVAEYNK